MLARALQQPVEDELRARPSLVLDDGVERIDPVSGLVRVAVGQLPLEVAEVIEHVRCSLGAHGQGVASAKWAAYMLRSWL